MNAEVLGTCLLIIIARIGDVSLGTLRTICVVNGQRGVAWILGFFEILIWLMVVSKVINSLDDPAYAIAYALGFATGNFIGITLEKYVAFGEQVVRVFTRQGVQLAEDLRGSGFVVTRFAGEGRDGPVDLLFIETPRKLAPKAAQQAKQLDSDCFIVVDDVRTVSSGLLRGFEPTGWRAILKKK